MTKTELKPVDFFKVVRFKDGAKFVDGKIQGENCERFAVKDGNNYIYLIEEKRDITEYIDEVKNGNNECAYLIGTITTQKGNRFVIWGDWEIDDLYMSKTR